MPTGAKLAILAAIAISAPAFGQTPVPTALVIGNSSYTAFPKLPACDLSTNLVASVLTRAGFKVTRQNNLSNARLGTAISSAGEDAAVSAGSRTLIYICSYAVSYSDRLFIVPAESRLDRDSDVLSQGIVARLLMSSVAGPGSAAGLVLMDVAPPPKGASLSFGSMLRASDAAHGGLAAASLPAPETLGPGPLAAGLAEAVGQGPLEVGALLEALSAQPAVRRALSTIRLPAEPSWLIDGPGQATTPAVTPATASSVPVPPVAAPRATAPVDATALADPNAAERRRLQLALGKLGYYRGRVDGVFAIDTAAAVRQFQRDSNAEPTGKLTIKQMEQVLQ